VVVGNLVTQIGQFSNAKCPPGMAVTGGGFVGSSAVGNSRDGMSVPTVGDNIAVAGERPDGWRIQNGTNASITAYAVCVQ
jgi:hypothetical protein